MLQRGYDAGLSGANLAESTLNASNVAPGKFGQLFTLSVDDAVFAQPLYVPNVAVAGQGVHNVLYVATMSDSLYAFDADTGGPPLWSVNLAYPIGEVPVPFGQFVFQNNQNIVGNLGILSTPVIDSGTGTMYVVACTLEGGTMAYRLHAIDITSGTELHYPGTEISGSYNGLNFNPRFVTQRASLTLADYQVVFAFAAVEAEYAGENSGWVMAYDEGTLQQSGIFATQSSANGGGVWQSGRPPVVDGDGNIFVASGNAWGNGYDGVNDFSESVIKLDPGNGLSLINWFTPDNWNYLDQNDLDLSSSGPMLIPGTTVLVTGGKSGILYVLNSNHLGHIASGDTQVYQELTISADEIRGGPVFWQRSSGAGGPLLYDWGAYDAPKAYAFYGQSLSNSPVSQGSGQQDWPGGILTLSANADQAGSGVLWATVTLSGDEGNNPPQPGALYALDASDVSHKLWDSTMSSSDRVGNFGKFVPPMIANGRVYVATWSNRVDVYGLLSTFTTSPSALSFGNQPAGTQSASQAITVTNTGKVPLQISSVSLSGSGSAAFSQTNNCSSSVAVGSSCTINARFAPSTAGSTAATLSIASSGGAPTQTITLSGTGVAPSLSVTPNALAFGSLSINTASAPQSVTVTNTGSAPLSIAGIAISGGGAQSFSQTSNCGSSLSAGAGCNVRVTFTPITAGSIAATLGIDTGVGTSSVALSGSGSFQTQLQASAATVTTGVADTLSWSSTPNATCTASGGASGDHWTGNGLAASGSQAVTETVSGTYTYAMSCSLNGVSAGASAQVIVTAPPPTVTLSATPTAVNLGSSVTLTWNSTNAASCVASGGQSGDTWAGSRPTQGNAPVTPNAAGSVTYKMTCSSGSQSALASATVSVSAASSSGGTSGSSGGSGGGGGGGGGAVDAALLLALTMLLYRRARLAGPGRILSNALRDRCETSENHALAIERQRSSA